MHISYIHPFSKLTTVCISDTMLLNLKGYDDSQGQREMYSKMSNGIT